MNKYLLMGFMLFCVSFAFARPPTGDMWIYYKYQISYCKAYIWANHIEYLGDPDCITKDTYAQIKSLGAGMFGDGSPGALSQLEMTMGASRECYPPSGGVDTACLQRYRSQFRQQLGTFNSLMGEGNGLLLIAGAESVASECLKRPDFFLNYLQYHIDLADCNNLR